MKLNEIHYLTGMRQLKTSSPLFRDTRFSCCSLIEWTFMRQCRAIRAKLFGFILQICQVYKCRATLERQLRDICECLTTFARISLSFACFLKTVARLSNDIRATVVNLSHCKFATISQVRDSRTNVVHDYNLKCISLIVGE